MDLRAAVERASQDLVGERVFNERADCAADRTRAVFRVRAGVDQTFDHVVVDLELAALVGEARDELGELQTDDPAEFLGAELAEDDQFVEEELVNSSCMNSNFGYELDPDEGNFIEKRKTNNLINSYKKYGKSLPVLNMDEIDKFADYINNLIEKRVD